MAGAGPLYEATKLGVLVHLHAVQRAHGHPSAGVVAEAVTAAVRTFIRETQGPEAAFSVMTRHADAAIAPALRAAAVRRRRHRQPDQQQRNEGDRS